MHLDIVDKHRVVGVNHTADHDSLCWFNLAFYFQAVIDMSVWKNSCSEILINNARNVALDLIRREAFREDESEGCLFRIGFREGERENP